MKLFSVRPVSLKQFTEDKVELQIKYLYITILSVNIDNNIDISCYNIYVTVYLSPVCTDLLILVGDKGSVLRVM